MGNNIFDQFDQQAIPANTFDQFDAPAAPKEEAPGLIETFGRGVAQGATFGYADDMGMSKERNAAAAKANPWTHFFGQAAGAIAPTVAATVAAPEVVIPAAVAKAAPGVARAYSAARSLFVPGEIATSGQAALQGGKLATTYGALAGSGDADVKPTDTWGEALEKRGTGALEGGAAGAVAGPLFGLGAHGLYRAAQGVGGGIAQALDQTATGGAGALNTMVRGFERDRITPDDLIKQIRAEFPDDTQAAGGLAKRFWGGLQNKQPITADQVEEVVRRAGAGESAADISKALSPGGKGSGPGEAAVRSLLDELEQRHLGPLNLLDRAALVRPGSGDNTQMTMRAAAATPGDARSIARESLLERQTGASAQLEDLIHRAVGSSDLEGAMKQHQSSFRDAAAKLYAPAFAEEKAFDLSPVFAKWESQFDKMRGLIPDTVRDRLNKMMWSETDAAGNVIKTPPNTLQGFMYAREGLRDLIKELPEGNHLRRYLTKFYDEATDTVAATNKKWKTANDFYRDGAAADDAMELGKKLATRQGSASREALSELAKADKDFQAAQKTLSQTKKAYDAAKKAGTATPDDEAAYWLANATADAVGARQNLIRTAYAQNLTDSIANKGDTHDLVRGMLTKGSIGIIEKVMGKDAPQFIKGLRAQQAMHRTYSSQFGSQTAPLGEAVKDLNFAPRVEASWLNPLSWPSKAVDLAVEKAAQSINARRNTELMGIYTETNPLSQLDILKNAAALHQTRADWGNAVGRPALSSAAPILNAYRDSNSAATQPTPVMTPYKP